MRERGAFTTAEKVGETMVLNKYRKGVTIWNSAIEKMCRFESHIGVHQALEQKNYCI